MVKRGNPKVHYLTTGGGSTVQLSVKDRIVLGQILPTQADITTLRIVQEIQEQLSFSGDEHELFKIRSEGNQIFWDDDTKQDKTIEVSKAAWGIIVAELNTRNAAKTLTADHIQLYEIFVERSEKPATEETG